MTEEAQNIAIFEWLGWEIAPFDAEWHWQHTITGEKYYDSETPNYCLNLNLTHEAEKSVTDVAKYEPMLKWVLDRDWRRATVPVRRNPIYATAAQRSEAILRHVDLWKE